MAWQTFRYRKPTLRHMYCSLLLLLPGRRPAVLLGSDSAPALTSTGTGRGLGLGQPIA